LAIRILSNIVPFGANGEQGVANERQTIRYSLLTIRYSMITSGSPNSTG